MIRYRYNHKTGYANDLAPAPTGGPTEWNGNMVLDWATGYVLERDKCKENGVSLPGLRTRKLKSSATHKYHVGGPYNGAKLRKWTKIGTKKDSKRMIELLPDTYVVPPYKGRYVFDSTEDYYQWIC